MLKANLRDFAWNFIENEFVLYSAVNNNYFRLNETGKEIWDIIVRNTEGISVSSIQNELQKRYQNISCETIASDVNLFIDELLRYGAISTL